MLWAQYICRLILSCPLIVMGFLIIIISNGIHFWLVRKECLELRKLISRIERVVMYTHLILHSVGTMSAVFINSAN